MGFRTNTCFGKPSSQNCICHAPTAVLLRARAQQSMRLRGVAWLWLSISCAAYRLHCTSLVLTRRQVTLLLKYKYLGRLSDTKESTYVCEKGFNGCLCWLVESLGFILVKCVNGVTHRRTPRSTEKSDTRQVVCHKRLLRPLLALVEHLDSKRHQCMQSLFLLQ